MLNDITEAIHPFAQQILISSRLEDAFNILSAHCPSFWTRVTEGFVA